MLERSSRTLAGSPVGKTTPSPPRRSKRFACASQPVKTSCAGAGCASWPDAELRRRGGTRHRGGARLTRRRQRRRLRLDPELGDLLRSVAVRVGRSPLLGDAGGPPGVGTARGEAWTSCLAQASRRASSRRIARRRRVGRRLGVWRALANDDRSAGSAHRRHAERRGLRPNAAEQRRAAATCRSGPAPPAAAPPLAPPLNSPLSPPRMPPPAATAPDSSAGAGTATAGRAATARRRRMPGTPSRARRRGRGVLHPPRAARTRTP